MRPVPGVALIFFAGVCWSADHPTAPPAEGRYELPAVPLAAQPDPIDDEPRRVDGIVFRGNHALRSSAIKAVVEPYVGLTLTGADIEELRIALTHLYTDRGYINSGVLLDPEAPFKDGVLSFLAVEGHLQQVRLHGLKGLRSAYVIDRLRKSPDEVLNTEILRGRFQRLLDDPLFARINSRIEPGSELGEAVLDVDVQRARPYSLAVAVNNYRPPSIGEKAYDVSGQVRNFTGLGDIIDADVTGPLQYAGELGYSVAWQFPLNAAGTLASISGAKNNTTVTEEPLSPLDIHSVVERQEFKLTQPLWRSGSQQVNLAASISHEKNSTTLDGDLFSFLPGSAEGVTRAISERLSPEWSYRSTQQYLGIRISALHSYLLDYQSGSASYTPPNQSYFVWSGQAHHVFEFANLPFELESRATLQRTHARISDLDALEIGGINSVRGFRENELLASNVNNFNIDFRWLALRSARAALPALTLGTFFDWADGHDVGEPTDTLSSIGFSLRLKWTHVQADLAAGAKLTHPQFVNQEHGALQDHGLHLQIAATL